MPIDGTGHCSVCTPSDDNKNCTSYRPVQITIHGFDVESIKKEYFHNGGKT